MPEDEPYYPVNDEKNAKIYDAYKQLADKESKVIFGGRLGEYKYYDMDQVIAAALERCRLEFWQIRHVASPRNWHNLDNSLVVFICKVVGIIC